MLSVNQTGGLSHPALHASKALIALVSVEVRKTPRRRNLTSPEPGSRATTIKRRAAVVSKLISHQSQISTVQCLKFFLRDKFFKLKLLLMPLLQNRLTQAVVFCGRATLKGPKNRMWLASRSLPTTGLHYPDTMWGKHSTCKPIPSPHNDSTR
uniref:Uncharacterized protein n=1 Tax=Pipistrellus kuhlii TaxID=59472 RepID=A0A7J7W3H0_PIPKU|nr:hypothetical protein mPipKuh1_008142 [Pipistrellus kuhlii]